MLEAVSSACNGCDFTCSQNHSNTDVGSGPAGRQPLHLEDCVDVLHAFVCTPQCSNACQATDVKPGFTCASDQEAACYDHSLFANMRAAIIDIPV